MTPKKPFNLNLFSPQTNKLLRGMGIGNSSQKGRGKRKNTNSRPASSQDKPRVMNECSSTPPSETQHTPDTPDVNDDK